jgi:hypothetical protein
MDKIAQKTVNSGMYYLWKRKITVEYTPTA